MLTSKSIAAIREIVSKRLSLHGMETINLPLGTPSAQPHIPILVSANICTASRVTILFGDTLQDLGIFAMRIIGGRGGINAGSAVDFVKYVLSQDLETKATTADGSSGGGAHHTGIIIANCGQLRWHRGSGKAMTRASWDALRRPSAVHEAIAFDPVANTVEHNRNPSEHIAYILSTVVPGLCAGAKLDVIAISDSAGYVFEYLSEEWDVVKERMGSLALLFPRHDLSEVLNEEFLAWLRKRARGYITAESPAGMGIFGPLGGREGWQRGYGMNVYGLPIEVADESVFPRHFRWVVDWMREVARDPEYENEEIVELETGDVDVDEEEKVEWVGAEYWDTEDGKAQLTREDTVKGAASQLESGDGDGNSIAPQPQPETGEEDGKALSRKSNVGEEGKAQINGEGAGEGVEEVKVQIDEEDVGEENNTQLTGEDMEGGGKGQKVTEDTEDKTQIESKTKGGESHTGTEDTANDQHLGIDGAATDEIDISIPPERMERLQSFVRTDEGEPQMELSKEERAAILQITVASSPVKEEGHEKEGSE